VGDFSVKKFVLLSSAAACLVPTAAFAQSTGSVDFEEEIVVTGTRDRDVGGFEAPNAPKAKAIIDQEFIARSVPGQTVLDVINVVPGVSFQNNDAYGNSGGRLTIRGFDQTRVSYTLDGLQLNDSGNYEVYSNFSIDPEILEQVNVGLGSTDVDSPTASATGGTVNQRTRIPLKKFGVRAVGTLGQFDYSRGFLLVDSGELTASGTRGFVSASRSKYENPYNNYGRLDRKQYNARIYQPINANGDFVSLAGRYNRDRNNFFGSVPLRNDLATPLGFPNIRDQREYDIAVNCTVDAPQAGQIDLPNNCGTEFDRRYNPSNSWNMRGNSRFTLMDNLVLTIDPSYQYTKANGGGTVRGREGRYIRGGVAYTGFIGGSYFFGTDLNGDGDILDTCAPNPTTFGGCTTATAGRGVTLMAPSQTRTRRYGLITGLRWDATPDHSFRASYTRDHADHRQTGEVGRLQANGEPVTVFAIDAPIQDARGNTVQKRDRQSYAILDQVAGEWRGTFGPLLVNAGVRLPYFTRDLENNCFTTTANGFVDCFAGDTELEAAYAAAFPAVQGPQKRKLKYNKLLPNIGAVYDFSPQFSGFASYSKGLSVPSTDNLYNAFFFSPDLDAAKPDPETTDTLDAGARYRSGTIQAQIGGWFTKFNNRLASAYDPELERSVYRNLGRVDKWGFDASVAYQPMRALTLYGFGSISQSEIKDNLQIGGDETFSCESASPTSVIGLRNCAFTAGRKESGSPTHMYGASALLSLGPVDFGVTAKRTGPRYVYDTNVATFTGDVDNLGDTNAGNDPTVIYDAKTPAYWLVNLDARFNLASFGLAATRGTYLQLNVYNVFNQLYVGGFGGNLNQGIGANGVYSGPGFVQIGAPRTVSATLNVGF
jgi:iron complex outermembrane receptor protein